MLEVDQKQKRLLQPSFRCCRAEGNLRESARKAVAGGSLLLTGTQSLGRAAGRRYIRQGDANASPPDEVKKKIFIFFTFSGSQKNDLFKTLLKSM